MSKKLAELTFKGKRVFVRELTVKEVDEQLNELSEQTEPTNLDWMFGEQYLPESSLEKIIGQPVAEIMDDETAPSELEQIYQKAVEVNNFFADALGRMRKLADLAATLGLDKGLMGVLEGQELTTEPGSDGQPST